MTDPLLYALSPTTTAEPLFSGSACLTFLALVIALAVYLRQVSLNALDEIENIQAGKKPEHWPAGKPHSIKMIKNLESIRSTIQSVGFILFTTATFLGFRILYTTFRGWIGLYPWYLVGAQIADVALALLLALLLVGMWFIHHSAKSREIRVRRAMELFRRNRANEQHTQDNNFSK